MLSFKEIKQLQKSKKARDAQGLFVTEGRKLFEEAPAERIAQVVVSRTFMEKYPDVLDRLPEGIPASVDLSDERFAQIADTKTPQGILTIVKKKAFADVFAARNAKKTDAFSGDDYRKAGKGTDGAGSISEGDVRRDRNAAEKEIGLYLILENLQDPGNVGTILRTAEAAGVTAVYLTEGSADLYAPKTIRSTMGSIFRVPHFYVASAAELIYNMKRAGVRTYAAHLRGEKDYTGFDYREPSAFVIGNEGNGITDETAAACDALMRIPMCGKVESLNAAMAAGILMYEAARQRRE